MAKKKKTKKSKKSNGNNLFKDIEPVSGFSNLPKGRYEGFVLPGSAVIEPKRDAPGYRAVARFVVTSPDKYKNRQQRYIQDLTSEFGKGLFLGMLGAFDLSTEISTIEEAAEVLAETDNVHIRFYVGEPRDEYPPRVSVLERLEDEQDDDDAEDDDVEDDEDTEEEEEEEDVEEEEYTKKDIKKMSEEELDELAEEVGLDSDEYETYKGLREAIYEELGL